MEPCTQCVLHKWQTSSRLDSFCRGMGKGGLGHLRTRPGSQGNQQRRDQRRRAHPVGAGPRRHVPSEPRVTGLLSNTWGLDVQRPDG